MRKSSQTQTVHDQIKLVCKEPSTSKSTNFV